MTLNQINKEVENSPYSQIDKAFNEVKKNAKLEAENSQLKKENDGLTTFIQVVKSRYPEVYQSIYNSMKNAHENESEQEIKEIKPKVKEEVELAI